MPIYSLVRVERGVTPERADGHASSMHTSAGRGVRQLTASAQPIGRLATVLGDELGRPVVDETGLEGQYDFKLEWDLTDSIAGSDLGAANNSATGVSLATALKEQLGLRLVSKKGPVQVYVVEKLDRPSEN